MLLLGELLGEGETMELLLELFSKSAVLFFDRRETGRGFLYSWLAEGEHIQLHTSWKISPEGGGEQLSAGLLDQFSLFTEPEYRSIIYI